MQKRKSDETFMSHGDTKNNENPPLPPFGKGGHNKIPPFGKGGLGGFSGEKGFTLIEIIVTLVLVGITAALAGMWIVSVANGYVFAKVNAKTAQNAQLAMTRLTKEFTALQLHSVTGASNTGITFTRPGTDSITVSRTGDGPLLLNGNTLTDSDSVSAFSLNYYVYDPSTNSYTCESWSTSTRIIEITLTLTGGNNTPVTFVQRVAPRNL